MSAHLDIPFRKMEGCGNDYLYVDLGELTAADASVLRDHASALARAMSDRHFGVGADGLILLERGAGADARMHMFNVDGSRGEMCGNALRCIAKYLGDHVLHAAQAVTIATDAGPRRAVLIRHEGEVVAASVAMDVPTFVAADIPFRPDLARVMAGGGEGPWQVEVAVGGSGCEASVLSMGNPHCVVFVPGDLDGLDVARIGPPLEKASMFPAGANIEFVRMDPDGTLCQRTWERGSGETLACGSGACAAVVAAVARGLVPRGRPLRVRLRGGELSITWAEDGVVHMEGPARFVFRGTYRARL